jgi:hydrogenase-4 component H
MASLVKKILWTLKVPYLPEAVKAVVKGPYTVKFPFGETVDTGCYRGAAVWDKDVCVGCGACYEVCPTSAIEMVDDTESSPPVRRFVLHYERCIFCGHCHYNCTTDDGIYQTTDWNLATFDRTDATTNVEKELLLCEKCGEVISTKDHVRWVARKVGPKVYANPTLALSIEGQLVSAPGREEAPRADRSDIMRILCPHCRRVVVLDETT